MSLATADRAVSRERQTPLGDVRATINYIAEMDERPIYYNDDPLGGNGRFEPHIMEIEDVSLRTTPPRLEVDGFEMFRHETRIRDLETNEPDQIEPYSLEIEEFLRAKFEADEVHVSRRQITRRQTHGFKTLALERGGVSYVHSDMSYPWASEKRSLDGYLPERPLRRILMVNLWRLLSPAPTNLPLALVDPRSIDPNDLVPGTTTVKDRSLEGEMLFVRHNPGHRWRYYSTQDYDDLLVFKQFDSATQEVWFAPHSAFTNPAAPDDAAPRVSREVRAAIYWFAD